jgi:hypothetical protein
MVAGCTYAWTRDRISRHSSITMRALVESASMSGWLRTLCYCYLK